MRKIVTLAMLMAAAAFVGCQKESATDDGGGTPGKEATVEIRLANTATSKAPSDFEDGKDYENAVKVVEVYVFDSAGNPDKKVGATDGNTDGNGYFKTTSLTSGKVTNLIVSSGTDKTFVAVVNMNLGPLAAGEKYADLKAKMAKAEFKATAGGSDHNARDTRTATGFEMMGEKTGVEIKDAVEGQKVNITVDRLSSKVLAPTFFSSGNNPVEIVLTASDVETVWGENSGINPADISFQFNGFALINGVNKSHLYFIGNPDGDDTNTPWAIDQATWVAGKSYLRSSFNSSGFYTNNYSGYGSADWFLDAANTDAIYFNENKPGRITVDGQTGSDPKTVVAMMVKGTLKVAGEPTKDAVRYWRLNMVRADYYHILRNCVYRLNVAKLTTPGHGTPKDAEEDPKIIPDPDDSVADIEISISKWRVNIQNYEM